MILARWMEQHYANPVAEPSKRFLPSPVRLHPPTPCPLEAMRDSPDAIRQAEERIPPDRMRSRFVPSSGGRH